MNARHLLKTIAHGAATIVVAPALVSFRLRAVVFGPDRALEGSSQALSLIPGLVGQYLRRAFLRQVLTHCDRSVTVEFGTVFSQVGCRLEHNVYVGPACHLGLVHLEPDVLIAAGVHIPSGGDTHGTQLVSVPIREQPGNKRLVRVGRGSWIGSAAVVLADVGRDSVVAAGAVVTRPIPDRVIAAGVPARVVKVRMDLDAPANGEITEPPGPASWRLPRSRS
jgi:acetyltransferase-like isoleucine patch superfamily enzyme